MSEMRLEVRGQMEEHQASFRSELLELQQRLLGMLRMEMTQDVQNLTEIKKQTVDVLVRQTMEKMPEVIQVVPDHETWVEVLMEIETLKSETSGADGQMSSLFQESSNVVSQTTKGLSGVC